jgi:hypothetical protein
MYYEISYDLASLYSLFNIVWTLGISSAKLHYLFLILVILIYEIDKLLFVV